jgi:tetratricopeptide (TPR) repeat protein
MFVGAGKGGMVLPVKRTFWAFILDCRPGRHSLGDGGLPIANWRVRPIVNQPLWTLLAIFLAANAPICAERAQSQPPAKAAAAPDPSDPIEKEYHKLMENDDDAHADADRWILEARATAAKGDKKLLDTLGLRIKGRLSPVRTAYEDFLARHGSHARARIAFGSFLNEEGEEDAAVDQWEKAREVDPSIPAVWNNLANFYGDHGPVKKAFEYYAKAMELDPTQSRYDWNLGMVVYLFRKDAMEYYHLDEKQVFDKAFDLYRQAIKLDPTNFVLSTDYAESFYGPRPPMWTEGLAAWEQTLKVAQSDYEREGVRLHFARIKIKLGRLEEAQRDLDAVTNAMYIGLKRTLQNNLDAAKAGPTNAPPAPQSPSAAK